MEISIEEVDKEVSQYTTGAFSTYDMETFVPEIKKLSSGQVYLEVGVDKGKSLLTAHFFASEGVKLVGVDLVDTPERIEVFRLFDSLGERFVFIHADSVAASKIFSRTIEVLFIDGDHSYEGCKRDIEAWLPLMYRKGVILFHDCDESSPGVMKAANEFFGNKVKTFKTETKNTSIAKVQL